MTKAQEIFALVAAMAAENEEFAEEMVSNLYYVPIIGGDKEDKVNRLHDYAKLARSFGARTTKRYSDTDLHIDVEVDNSVVMTMYVSRGAVCEARVVGTETVEVPDYAAAPKKTVERDVVEWDCHPLLEQIGNGDDE